jgi:predicted metallopeptidase
MEFNRGKDIQLKLSRIQAKLRLPWIDTKRIVCFRSHGSKARARARIWSFPRIWQLALNLPPHYCLEIISEKFDSLKPDDQTRIIIHEIMHIPKNFSGALLPHRGRGRVVINARSVEQLFKLYQKK